MSNTSGQKNITSSIARRINASIWLDKLGSYIALNIVLLLVSVVYFVLHRFGYSISSGMDLKDFLSGILNVQAVGESFSEYILEAHFQDGSVLTAPASEWLQAVLPGAVCVTALEGLDLFFSLFGTHRILKKLRPLDDIAARARAISRISTDTTTIEHLEEAIRSASPSDGQVHLGSGDKELMKVESALNQLLLRMEENYRQQTRFVSDASHELRTPIAVIQGYADLLDRWGKDDPAVLEEGITSIKNESQRMKDLVEDMLFLARGDSGRNILHPEEVDLNEMMREVWEESSMIDAHHEYVLDLNEGRAVVSADPSMLRQSIRIFVQNASKYSPQGSRIRLAVRSQAQAARADAPHGTVSYIVEDEGCGISKEDLKHIFERFYRSDKARNAETGGTGLGLSIAKWIVDAHGGTIDVVSRPDFGSRFTVTFPAA